jgi:predicted nucleic acid-binding protein
MLVDTSAWIDYFNGHGSPEAQWLTRAIAESEQIHLPGLVLTEILLGLRDDQQANQIADLLMAFDEVAAPSRSDHIEAARLYRHCRSQGFTIRSPIDCVIAQLCLRDKLPLLSKDRDFRVIAKFFPLQLVSI